MSVDHSTSLGMCLAMPVSYVESDFNLRKILSRIELVRGMWILVGRVPCGFGPVQTSQNAEPGHNLAQHTMSNPKWPKISRRFRIWRHIDPNWSTPSQAGIRLGQTKPTDSPRNFDPGNSTTALGRSNATVWLKFFFHFLKANQSRKLLWMSRWAKHCE